MKIALKVWGDYALFARPEFKVERVSYDVMTPSAARNILQAIYWNRGMDYIIDSIRVLNPIRHINVRRNEVRSVINSATLKKYLLGANENLFLNTSSNRSQRTGIILKDVAYVIEAHIEVNRNAKPEDTVHKFHSIFTRRASRGQCFSRPYFGNREFPAFFTLITEDDKVQCPDSLLGTKELGSMLYDINYQDELATESFVPERIPMFFEARLVDGILKIPPTRGG